MNWKQLGHGHHSLQPTSMPRRVHRTIMITVARRCLAAALALTLLVALGGLARVTPAAASAAPAGFYSSTPDFNTTVSSTYVAFNAEIALVPDAWSPPTVDWGDGSSGDAAIVCKLPDGSTGDEQTCFPTIAMSGIPIGTLWLQDSHNYGVAGTFHPTVTYQTGGVSYSASWTVVSSGTTVPLFLSYDANLVDVSLHPTPLSDSGVQQLSGWNVTAHAYTYSAGTQVTITATPKRAGVGIAGWSHIICNSNCYNLGDSDALYATSVCGATSTTSCSIKTLAQNTYGDNPNDPGVRVLSIGTVALASSANPSTYLQPFTLTATVSPAPAGGTMSFTQDGYSLSGCEAQPVVNGVATCSFVDTPMTAGTHQIVATFSGSGGLQGGASSTMSQIVQIPQVRTQTTLIVTTLNGQVSATAVTGQPIQLTATVASDFHTPTGGVAFYADGQYLGIAWPQGAGGTSQATLTTTSLPTGRHAITATYEGDTVTQESASNAVSQVVQAGSFLNDTAADIVYAGNWGYSTNRGYGDFQDDEHYLTQNNYGFAFTFKGTGIRVLGETNADGSIDEVYVDGVDKGSISTVSQNRLAQQVLYNISGLKSGSHAIKLVKTSGGFLELDALAIVQ